MTCNLAFWSVFNDLLARYGCFHQIRLDFRRADLHVRIGCEEFSNSYNDVVNEREKSKNRKYRKSWMLGYKIKRFILEELRERSFFRT